PLCHRVPARSCSALMRHPIAAENRWLCSRWFYRMVVCAIIARIGEISGLDCTYVAGLYRLILLGAADGAGPGCVSGGRLRRTARIGAAGEAGVVLDQYRGAGS